MELLFCCQKKLHSVVINLKDHPEPETLVRVALALTHGKYFVATYTNVLRPNLNRESKLLTMYQESRVLLFA